MGTHSARQLARKLFDLADTDRSGYLDRKEAKDVQQRLERRCPEIELDPPFDEEADFAIMDKDQMGTVSWEEFETWWMGRTGDQEPSCPVLPEAMVSKIGEGVARPRTLLWDSRMIAGRALELLARPTGPTGPFILEQMNGLWILQIGGRLAVGSDPCDTRTRAARLACG